MTSQVIKYHKKSVYGNEMLYITDAEQEGKRLSVRGLLMLGVECVHTPIN